MNINHKQKIYGKPASKLTDMVIILLLGILAIMIGIQCGNLWYKLDINVVEKIDAENFRDTINLAFPIIETIYNSGKFSVSFSGEIKELFTNVFGFDLDSPATIFNVQSPLFMSYSRNIEKSRDTGMDGANNQPDDGSEAGEQDEDKDGAPGDGERDLRNEAVEPGTKDGKGGNAGNTGNGDGAGKGNGPGNGAGSGFGEGAGNGNGTDGGSGPAPGQGNTTPGKGENKPGGKPGDAAAPGNNGSRQDGVSDPQPVSSIAFEVEDEDENDESDMVAHDQIVIRNFTKHKIDIAALLKEPLNLDLSKKGPKVLIYHTHTSESYVLKEEDIGKNNIPSFNTNPKYNVVRVGEELARNLEKYGIETLHNGTVHDKNRDSAYGVSIRTLQSYKSSYPSIKVFIDIHRDGVDSKKPKLRLTKKINGKNAAQVMFVVGSDGLLPHPKWKENLKFVLKIQQKLNEKYPGLARPVWIVGKRYNQQISNQSILIEVGGDGNLLSECLESTKYLAEALSEVMMGK